MKLNGQQLAQYTAGAVRTHTDPEGYIHFERFFQTGEQLFPGNPGMGAKAHATASVCLDLVTDAEKISFDWLARQGSSRHFFSLDLYVDGALYRGQVFEDAGEAEAGRFAQPLPGGEKRVTVYLPCLYGAAVRDVELEGASFVRGHEYDHSIVAYGDSITQGYDARHASLCYASTMARRLNARLVNKAIGGDFFHPELVEGQPDSPDLVTIALGTNDWRRKGRADVEARAAEFLRRVKRAHPGARIFLVTPLWRADREEETAFGPFPEMAACLRAVAAEAGGIRVLDGQRMAPHDAAFFADGRLHPDDLGQVLYGERLAQEIRAAL